MKDGKEIAVKVLTSNSFQGKREFANEVIFHELNLFLHSVSAVKLPRPTYINCSRFFILGKPHKTLHELSCILKVSSEVKKTLN
jgi:hypothetical protein